MNEHMNDIERAIVYYEDAVRESDEIIADCSPALQAELSQQKEHFVVALDALRAQATRKSAEPNGWISVKNRLPELGQTVVVLIEGITLALSTVRTRGSMEAFCRENGLTRIFNITHWMPLPNPPKEEFA